MVKVKAISNKEGIVFNADVPILFLTKEILREGRYTPDSKFSYEYDNQGRKTKMVITNCQEIITVTMVYGE